MVDVLKKTRLHEDNTKTPVASPEERFALEFDLKGMTITFLTKWSLFRFLSVLKALMDD